MVDADVVGIPILHPRHRLTPKPAGRPANWGRDARPHPRGLPHASHKTESPANASTKTSQRPTRRGTKRGNPDTGKHTPANQPAGHQSPKHQQPKKGTPHGPVQEMLRHHQRLPRLQRRHRPRTPGKTHLHSMQQHRPAMPNPRASLEITNPGSFPVLAPANAAPGNSPDTQEQTHHTFEPPTMKGQEVVRLERRHHGPQS